MESGWLARARWRQRGAWLWPTFVVAIVLDGVIVTFRPVIGDRQSFAGGVLGGLIFSLLAVLLGSHPLGSLLRGRRADLPAAVARNYGGTVAVLAVTALLLAVGLVRHSSIVTEQRALDDAIVRAEAFIGDRAPAAFRANAAHPDTYAIQPGSIYRTCVANQAGTRTYCVIVKTWLPLARSVVPDGYEPNSIFAAGTN